MDYEKEQPQSDPFRPSATAWSAGSEQQLFPSLLTKQKVSMLKLYIFEATYLPSCFDPSTLKSVNNLPAQVCGA